MNYYWGPILHYERIRMHAVKVVGAVKVYMNNITKDKETPMQ